MSTQSPIVVEQVYDAPIDKVWQALTDNEQMKRWYFDIPVFEPVHGFVFSFEAGPEGKKYQHNCKITEVIPHKKISYTWRYAGYEGVSEVSFELFDESPNTRVRLTHTGIDTFPESNPDLAPHNFQQGWDEIMGTNLKQFVEKGNN